MGIHKLNRKVTHNRIVCTHTCVILPPKNHSKSRRLPAGDRTGDFGMLNNGLLFISKTPPLPPPKPRYTGPLPEWRSSTASATGPAVERGVLPSLRSVPLLRRPINFSLRGLATAAAATSLDANGVEPALGANGAEATALRRRRTT